MLDVVIPSYRNCRFSLTVCWYDFRAVHNSQLTNQKALFLIITFLNLCVATHWRQKWIVFLSNKKQTGFIIKFVSRKWSYLYYLTYFDVFCHYFMIYSYDLNYFHRKCQIFYRTTLSNTNSLLSFTPPDKRTLIWTRRRVWVRHAQLISFRAPNKIANVSEKSKNFENQLKAVVMSVFTRKSLYKVHLIEREEKSNTQPVQVSLSSPYNLM